jgi:hypothetical protein
MVYVDADIQFLFLTNRSNLILYNRQYTNKLMVCSLSRKLDWFFMTKHLVFDCPLGKSLNILQ